MKKLFHLLMAVCLFQVSVFSGVMEVHGAFQEAARPRANGIAYSSETAPKLSKAIADCEKLIGLVAKGGLSIDVLKRILNAPKFSTCVPEINTALLSLVKECVQKELESSDEGNAAKWQAVLEKLESVQYSIEQQKKLIAWVEKKYPVDFKAKLQRLILQMLKQHQRDVLQPRSQALQEVTSGESVSYAQLFSDLIFSPQAAILITYIFTIFLLGEWGHIVFEGREFGHYTYHKSPLAKWFSQPAHVANDVGSRLAELPEPPLRSVVSDFPVVEGVRGAHNTRRSLLTAKLSDDEIAQWLQNPVFREAAVEQCNRLAEGGCAHVEAVMTPVNRMFSESGRQFPVVGRTLHLHASGEVGVTMGVETELKPGCDPNASDVSVPSGYCKIGLSRNLGGGLDIQIIASGGAESVNSSVFLQDDSLATGPAESHTSSSDDPMSLEATDSNPHTDSESVKGTHTQPATETQDDATSSESREHTGTSDPLKTVSPSGEGTPSDEGHSATPSDPATSSDSVPGSMSRSWRQSETGEVSGSVNTTTTRSEMVSRAVSNVKRAVLYCSSIFGDVYRTTLSGLTQFNSAQQVAAAGDFVTSRANGLCVDKEEGRLYYTANTPFIYAANFVVAPDGRFQLSNQTTFLDLTPHSGASNFPTYLACEFTAGGVNFAWTVNEGIGVAESASRSNPTANNVRQLLSFSGSAAITAIAPGGVFRYGDTIIFGGLRVSGDETTNRKRLVKGTVGAGGQLEGKTVIGENERYARVTGNEELDVLIAKNSSGYYVFRVSDPNNQWVIQGVISNDAKCFLSAEPEDE